MRSVNILLILSSLIFTSGCLFDNNERPGEITVSAAISLSDALNEIGEVFMKDHPDVMVYFNFAASGTLMRQIEQGASVDVFASASQKEMAFLEKKGLILRETRTNFTRNKLVIVSSSGLTIKELNSPLVKRIAAGNPKTVPAGYYAQEFLKNAGLFNELQGKLIYAENVRQVLNYVELGEVDAGFVYLSDTSKSDLSFSGVDESLYPDIVYPVAAVKYSQRTEIAVQFIEYMLSEEGQSILHKHGFG